MKMASPTVRVPPYAWYVVGVLTLANISSFVDRQILTLLVGSQLYLFLRGDRALRRSRLSPRRKRLLRLGLAGFFASIVIQLPDPTLLSFGASYFLMSAVYATAVFAGFRHSKVRSGKFRPRPVAGMSTAEIT